MNRLWRALSLSKQEAPRFGTAEMATEAKVVVLGAGVLGLTTALSLAKRGYKHVTVVARHLPGDCHLEYTSSWAGANFVPVTKEGTEEASWDVMSWKEFVRLAKDVPAAGVFIADKFVYCRNQDMTPDELKDLWFLKDLVYDFRQLDKKDLPDFADWGYFYRTIGLDPSTYLHFLRGECLTLGVKFRRLTVEHISEAFVAIDDRGKERANVVVNCTGLLASKLGGVMDKTVRPTRGQLVIVENESHGQYSISGENNMVHDIGECCYIIDRPSGGGTALGGSYYETDNEEPDMELATRIMERSIKVCPHLVPAGKGVEALRVIRHQVGLRPVRDAGPRIESESISDSASGALRIVHCYGAGGFGFQSSYGMADKAARLVDETLAVSPSL